MGGYSSGCSRQPQARRAEATHLSFGAMHKSHRASTSPQPDEHAHLFWLVFGVALTFAGHTVCREDRCRQPILVGLGILGIMLLAGVGLYIHFCPCLPGHEERGLG